jgi:hypothetical protein
MRRARCRGWRMIGGSWRGWGERSKRSCVRYFRVAMRLRLFFFGIILLASQSFAQEKGAAVGRLWHIAYQFHPRPPEGSSIPGLPVGDPAWDGFVERAMAEDPTACTEPLLLVLMRLYVAHLQCCNQSYDINSAGARSSILNAFMRCTDPPRDGERVEFYSSAAPYEYYLQHKKRFRSKSVRAEASKIRKELRRIRRGI